MGSPRLRTHAAIWILVGGSQRKGDEIAAAVDEQAGRSGSSIAYE
jgi:hypothetical protein